MWASYGDNNRGVCLVFDKYKLSKIIRDQFTCRVFEGEVAYQEATNSNQGWLWKVGFSKKAPPFSLSDLYKSFEGTVLKGISNYYEYYFFTKHEDWHGEQEYRYVLCSELEEPEYLDFKDALVGVTVGIDCEESSITELVSLVSPRGIPVFQAFWSLDGWSQKGLNDLSQEYQ